MAIFPGCRATAIRPSFTLAFVYSGTSIDNVSNIPSEIFLGPHSTPQFTLPIKNKNKQNEPVLYGTICYFSIE